MLHNIVSILMPIKNEGNFIEKTVESILNQDEINFELIVVDDHSDDSTIDILKRFNDPRLRIHTNEGKGIIDALQMAFRLSKGMFITRHDGDDLMPVQKLSELKNILLEKGPGHISTGKVKYFSDHGTGDGFLKYEKWLNGLCDNQNHYEDIFKECVICSSNWMAFKNDLEEIKAFSNLRYPEDYHLVFKFFDSKFKIITSPKVTHFWRDHPNRASRTLEQYKDQKFFDLKVNYFFKAFPNSTPVVWGAGPRGKELAKTMLKKQRAFRWVCSNPRKINKSIYGVKVEDPATISEEIVLIAVSQKNLIKEQLIQKNIISYEI